VQAAATWSLQTLIELTDDDKSEIQAHAQRMLDDLDSGIRLVSLSLPEKPSAPFAIESFRVALQEAKVFADRQVVQARQRSDQILNRAAGKDYREIIRLIEQYEDALELGEEDRAEEILVSINARLESDQTGGDVATIIGDARSYESQVEATLGNEARRFASQLAAYRSHPDLIVMERWQEAVSQVFERPDVELIKLAPGMALALSVSGNDEIAEIRRKLRLDLKQIEAVERAREELGITGPYIKRGRDITTDGPGRQLRLSEEGGVESIRSNRP
jgi:hypothetical protein